MIPNCEWPAPQVSRCQLADWVTEIAVDCVVLIVEKPRCVLSSALLGPAQAPAVDSQPQADITTKQYQPKGTKWNQEYRGQHQRLPNAVFALRPSAIRTCHECRGG